MGSEEEERPPKLPLFSHPPLISPEHSGTLTPPLHTLASVPFQWEEEPGKPLPCTTLALTNHHTFKCLDLPPRLLNEGKMTKTPSPTTVLEGPYNSQVGRSILESSSFRFLRKRRQGSFDGGTRALSCGGSRGSSPDRGLLGAMVLSSSSSNSKKDRGLFGSWRKRGVKSEVVHGGNFVFSSFSDDGTGSCEDGGSTVKVRMSRKRSLLGLSHAKSHFWATIYGALKQVIPRRSTKWRKDAL